MNSEAPMRAVNVACELRQMEETGTNGATYVLQPLQQCSVQCMVVVGGAGLEELLVHALQWRPLAQEDQRLY